MRISIRTYSELVTIPTFEERFDYLRLDGIVGKETFGYDRYLNQILYNSQEWRRFRNGIIVRDNACDLAHEDHEIPSWKNRDGRIRGPRILIHHINPITVDDIVNRRAIVFDPENTITTILSTHNAIHYGDESLLPKSPVERSQNDMCPWRHN